LEPIMSEATDRPDADAWAKASAEDIAAEHARRRTQAGQGAGSATDELRRLAEAVGDRLAGLNNPAVQLAAQGVISQVRSVVEPIKDRNPDLFDHLSAAGAELLAAYRSAVAGQEARWTSGSRPGEEPPRSTAEHIDLD
jgi:hypothetical protein